MATETVEPPTHLIAKPGDRIALCEVKDPVPNVWIYWANAHVVGHGMKICADCWTGAGGDDRFLA